MTPNHVDPAAEGVPAPDRSSWDADRREVFESSAMEAFREGLRRPGMSSVRESVISDLAEFFGVDEPEVVHRATHSRAYANEAWGDMPANPSPLELQQYYQRNHSWLFGLLWYAYLQAEGYAWPVAAGVAHDLTDRTPGHVLDFGAGVGAASLMFAELGWTATVADISDPLLTFAAFRHQRRGRAADLLDLKLEEPPAGRFDAVCAIQTFAHVPDVGATAAQLHRSLRPGGRLYADFDVSKRSGTDSRLYDDDLPLRLATQRCGFVEQRRIGRGVTARYLRVEPTGPVHLLRGVRDRVLLGAPRRWYRDLRYRQS